jgi:hypothetical protein
LRPLSTCTTIAPMEIVYILAGLIYALGILYVYGMAGE